MAEYIYKKYNTKKNYSYKEVYHSNQWYRDHMGVDRQLFYLGLDGINRGGYDDLPAQYKISNNKYVPYDLQSTLGLGTFSGWICLEALKLNEERRYNHIVKPVTTPGTHILNVVYNRSVSVYWQVQGGRELIATFQGYEKTTYIGEEVAEDGVYPDNGVLNNVWYEKTILANQPPTISGYDYDLGDKFENFVVEYLVQDINGDEVKVSIKLDDLVVQAPTVTTLGVKRYYNVELKNLKLGKHKLEIIATDFKGESATRTYTFSKVNSAPIISGIDEDLGAKNTAFTYVYRVSDSEGDSVKVVEKLNGNVIRTLDNAPLDEDLSITIDFDTIKKLELNKANTIEIEASDGTAKSYRRIRFTRNNIPPIISDTDKDLGEFTSTFSYKWSVTDPEGDKMSAVIFLDDKIIKDRHSIEDSEEQTIEFTGLDMFKIPRGKHTLKIVVEDDNGFPSERKVTFTRKIERLIMKLGGNGIETEEMAKRILVSSVGVYVAKGAVVKYEVCNNSFDENPTWEDATNMVKAGKAFNFENTTKTSEKSGIDIKVSIEKGTSTGLSFINAIGGSYD